MADFLRWSLVVILGIGALISIYNNDHNPTSKMGDFICPKCGRKSGVEKGLEIGSATPWRRFRCKSCGFDW